MFCEGAFPLFHMPARLEDAPPTENPGLLFFFSLLFSGWGLLFQAAVTLHPQQRNALSVAVGRALAASAENAVVKAS